MSYPARLKRSKVGSCKLPLGKPMRRTLEGEGMVKKGARRYTPRLGWRALFEIKHQGRERGRMQAECGSAFAPGRWLPRVELSFFHYGKFFS
jgi:hypothetical protein